ncbi:unnamed protein product [Strongylus vulgaris]|uniref:Uncharacterized protein n=1 Tax=Strongylus vulgaris TaxID=40348 RepID=A0A3P7JWJ5_STRVU|nr:unnamed protein product [Strongylus vulgaris]
MPTVEKPSTSFGYHSDPNLSRIKPVPPMEVS